jgi:hypothetical protein
MDLRWLDDMQIDAAETSGDEEELEQDVYHVIEQDYGTNIDDPERGLGIANMSSQALTTSTKQWETKSDTEVAKDDRCKRVTSTIEVSDDGSTWIRIEVESNEDVIDVNVPVPTAGSEGN